ncbi:GNAT family N-acetyltransferase [Montanilutibacter psychrotolerans]|uniref:GNAT family N-acetyltransferase n=1 Tax=Montanilutibacter psychrotolerans TaxID=1327343 RepID=A0A3M8SSK5_9GAMM|nr:GNAT family N-acetyltransferase [Lysobacter psychrotolerans]RNF84311.1 GNAT family N-acetyltransferase [Lysobacter psychrotolerans]
MDADIQARRCTPGDEDALSLIGQATFLETFAGLLGGRDIVSHCASAHSVPTYRTWLTAPDHALWLAETSPGNAPVGYAVVAPSQLPLPDAASDDLELKRIYLLGKFHGGGIGKRLLREGIAHARSVGARRLLLGVYAHNAAAIGFYQHVGFRTLGARKFNVGGRDYDDHILGMPLAD